MKWDELTWRDSEPIDDQRLITAVETHFGVKFPGSYRECIQACDGGVPDECTFLHHRADDEDHEDAIGILLSVRREHHANVYEAREGLGSSFTGGVLPIADNGCGFDPEVVQSHGLGSGIMHDRAGDIDASLTIKSQPDQGTEVLIVWEAQLWRRNHE